jgi:uncharacterized membrane protein
MNDAMIAILVVAVIVTMVAFLPDKKKKTITIKTDEEIAKEKAIKRLEKRRAILLKLAEEELSKKNKVS